MKSSRKKSRRIGWREALLLSAVAVLGLATAARAIPGDTLADLELGQIDFTHNGLNSVDGSSLYSPTMVAVDKSAMPHHLYASDFSNNRVLGWNDVAAFANGAPADLVIGQPSLATSTANNGGVSAGFYGPYGVAVDSQGNLFVADYYNHRVLGFDAPFAACSSFPCVGAPARVVFGQAGDFTSTYCNFGANTSPNAGSASSLCYPVGLAFDRHDNLYVADSGNNRVLEFNTPLMTTATPGSGDTVADLAFGQGGDNFNSIAVNSGGISAASLSAPYGVAVDTSDNVYIADGSNNRVLEYNQAASPPTNVTANMVFGQGGNMTSNGCNPNGPNANSLCGPYQVGVDGANNLYVADRSNSRVLVYNNPKGTDTIADVVFGQAESFTANSCNLGGGSAAGTLCRVQGVAIDSTGIVIIADTDNHRILTYTNPLTTDTIADHELGQLSFTQHTANTVDDRGLYAPAMVAVDNSANPPRVYVTDFNNHRVLGWHDVSALTNHAPADLVLGQPNFASSTANNGGLTAGGLYGPYGAAVDSQGNLYVADYYNSRVLEFDAPFAACASFPCVGGPANMVFGQVGDFTSGYCNFGANTSANAGSASSLCNPVGVALDAHDNLYIADSSNNRVLEFNTPLMTTAIPGSGDTVADLAFGQGGTNFNSIAVNSGGINAASLAGPTGVAVDGLGNVYIADGNNNRVLEYNQAGSPPTNVTANIIFGQGGNLATNNCNAGGLNADSLCRPFQIALDAANNLYVADQSNNRVLQYNNPRATDTRADGVLGQADNLTANSCNLGGGPAAGGLCRPQGVALDPSGNVYVADTDNQRALVFLQPFVVLSTPTVGPSATPTNTRTASATATRTPTPTASNTPSATSTATVTPVVTATSSATATQTATPTVTLTRTPTPTSTTTNTPTNSPAATGTATSTATRTAVSTATQTPTMTPAPGDLAEVVGVVRKPGGPGGEHGLYTVQGITVQLYLCEHHKHDCADNPDSLLGSAVTDANGLFTITFSAALLGPGKLYLASVEIDHFKVRALVTPRKLHVIHGGLGAGGQVQGEILIDPNSEAAVRLLVAHGLDNFSDDGLDAIIDAVAAANIDTIFDNLSITQATDVSGTTAVNDPMVQMSLQTNQFTPTPGPASCVGDCDGSGDVAITELVRMVDIAFDRLDVLACAAGDAGHDGHITINEIVTAVNNALGSCSAPPTETPTPVMASPTPTLPGGNSGPVVAGAATVMTDGMTVIPDIVAAIANGVKFGGAAAALLDAGGGSGAGSCPGGGSATRVGSFPFVNITLNGCTVPTVDGVEIFTGMVSVQFPSFSANLTILFNDHDGAEIRHAAATLSGSLTGSPGGTCTVNSLTLTITSGMLTTTTPSGTTVGVSFQGTVPGTVVGFTNVMFDANCVPVVYTLTFDGPAALLTPAGDSVPVTFANMVMNVDGRADPAHFDINGGMSATCFGGSAMVTTTMQLTIPSGRNCPTAGAISVTTAAGMARILYHPDESIDIDSDANGSIDATVRNCLDARLLMCLA
jgi:sugar lactone lactonase YvrE